MARGRKRGGEKKDKTDAPVSAAPAFFDIDDTEADTDAGVNVDTGADTDVEIEMPSQQAQPSLPVIPVYRVKKGTGITAGRRVLVGGTEVTAADFPRGMETIEALVKRGLLDVE